jgi:hypothetical protein
MLHGVLPVHVGLHGTLLICRMGCPLTEIVIETAIARLLSTAGFKNYYQYRVRRNRLITGQYLFSPIPPHQPRPSLGLVAPFAGCMAASAAHSFSDVPVAGDAAAVFGAGPPSEGRDWRGRK